MLTLGTVLAGLSAFGPAWLVRVGLVVAIAAAVVACTAAWREVSEARRSHAAQTLAASRAHGAALTAERRQSSSVIDALVARTGRAEVEAELQRATVTELCGTIAELQTTISGLRARQSVLAVDLEAAVGEIERRDQLIARLTETVRAREAELNELSTSTGQMRAIPRRMRTPSAPEQPDKLPETDELRRRSEMGVSDLVPVPVKLPNYEGERKLA